MFINKHISKMGIFNLPFCSIFVPFHFYLVMTLVVLCLDNIFMVCRTLNLQKLVQQNLFFWILVPLGGRGFVHAWAWFVIIV